MASRNQNRTFQPHYQSANDARTLRTREVFRDALLRLLKQKSLEEISIRDIAGEAGTSYVTFFRHHPTKEALLHDIAANLVRRLSELMLPALDTSDTRAACTALCAYVDEHRKLWSTLLTGGAAAVLREELLKNANEVAESRADPNSWLPAELAISLNISSTIEVLTWWLRQKPPLSIERVAAILERAVIAPIIEASQFRESERNRATTGVRSTRPARKSTAKKRTTKGAARRIRS
jgi:AcrR family transcriptional regulator